MKDTIVQGLQQAYQNLFHMIAEFLPRLVVMLVIILSGLLVAYALKYAVRAVLRLTRLDRLSEEAGASRVLRMAALPSMTEVLSFLDHTPGIHPDWNQHPEYCRVAGANFTTVAATAGNRRRDVDFVSGTRDRELSIPGGAACRRKRGVRVTKIAELVNSLRDLDFGDRHGFGRTGRRQANSNRGFFDRIRSIHAGTGDCVWFGRPRIGPPVSREIVGRKEGRQNGRVATAVIGALKDSLQIFPAGKDGRWQIWA
jgi:hypothetical protein